MQGYYIFVVIFSILASIFASAEPICSFNGCVCTSVPNECILVENITISKAENVTGGDFRLGDYTNITFLYPFGSINVTDGDLYLGELYKNGIGPYEQGPWYNFVFDDDTIVFEQKIVFLAAKWIYSFFNEIGSSCNGYTCNLFNIGHEYSALIRTPQSSSSSSSLEMITSPVDSKNFAIFTFPSWSFLLLINLCIFLYYS